MYPAVSRPGAGGRSPAGCASFRRTRRRRSRRGHRRAPIGSTITFRWIFWPYRSASASASRSVSGPDSGWATVTARDQPVPPLRRDPDELVQSSGERAVPPCRRLDREPRGWQRWSCRRAGRRPAAAGRAAAWSGRPAPRAGRGPRRRCGRTGRARPRPRPAGRRPGGRGDMRQHAGVLEGVGQVARRRPAPLEPRSRAPSPVASDTRSANTCATSALRASAGVAGSVAARRSPGSESSRTHDREQLVAEGRGRVRLGAVQHPVERSRTARRDSAEEPRISATSRPAARPPAPVRRRRSRCARARRRTARRSAAAAPRPPATRRRSARRVWSPATRSRRAAR